MIVPLTLMLLPKLGPWIHAQEIIPIPTPQGEAILGRLCLPSQPPRTLVIDVPSSGPHTYLDRRQVGRSRVVNLHDLYAQELNRRGVAYFSYHTRFTELDPAPPTFDRVDRVKFAGYTPMAKVQDLETVLTALRKDPRLASAKWLLLGWSEGSIIATLVAERQRTPVDGLLLAGTPVDDAYTTLLWQFSGAASQINLCRWFDTNGDHLITREEFEQGDARLKVRLGNKTFDQLDTHRDGKLTAEDAQLTLKPQLTRLLAAVEAGDDAWLWEHFFRVGSQWIQEHRRLASNRTRLLKLRLPVFLFHGIEDAQSPVQGIQQLKSDAEQAGLRHLSVHVFPKHDHSLETLGWMATGTPSEGLCRIFETAQTFK